jgi:hypothetical protein
MGNRIGAIAFPLAGADNDYFAHMAGLLETVLFHAAG